MIKYVLILVAVLVASISHAEVDTRARAAIDDIRLGKDNVNAIKNLYVRDTVALPAGGVAGAAIADSGITSAKIANGTIVDADISASAAIARSKLALGGITTNVVVAGNGTNYTFAVTNGLIFSITQSAP
jgi:hypothetical protein